MRPSTEEDLKVCNYVYEAPHGSFLDTSLQHPPCAALGVFAFVGPSVIEEGRAHTMVGVLLILLLLVLLFGGLGLVISPWFLVALVVILLLAGGGGIGRRGRWGRW